jgi:type IV pilus assembly protein PilO
MMEETSLFEKVEKIKMPYRILILLGTVVLIGGLFVWLFVIPKTAEIEKTEKDVAKLTQKISQAKIKKKNMAKFEAEKAEVDAQFQQALALLPNKREIPNLLRTVTQLGSDANLEFRLFSPNREKSKGFYVEIPVAIEVSGNYHDVALFFDKVGRMERIVNILNVDMKPSAALSTNLVTKCDAVTYRFSGSTNVQPKDDKKKKKKRGRRKKSRR